MILGLGIPELLIILVVILIIFGPKNLPKIGSAIGKTVKNVREGMEDGKDKPEEDDSVDVVEDEDDADAPAGTFCPKCGAANDASAHFCCKCGAKLGSDE